LISKEKEQTSRGVIDIPTRLAPRDTSILCRQTKQNFIKKWGKIIIKGGATRPKPSKENKEKETKKTPKQPKTD